MKGTVVEKLIEKYYGAKKIDKQEMFDDEFFLYCYENNKVKSEFKNFETINDEMKIDEIFVFSNEAEVYESIKNFALENGYGDYASHYIDVEGKQTGLIYHVQEFEAPNGNCWYIGYDNKGSNEPLVTDNYNDVCEVLNKIKSNVLVPEEELVL